MTPGEATPQRVVHSRSVGDTLAVGRAVAACCRAGDLIALRGDLGAGKTQLVRGLATGLGLPPLAVSSPTFVILHEYALPVSPARPDLRALVHVDAYRLESLDQIESVGWEAAGGNGMERELRDGAVVVIEWAQRLHDSLSDDRLEIDLTHMGDEERRITLTPRGAWIERLASLDAAMGNLDLQGEARTRP